MATFRGQAEYTVRRNGAVYVFGIKFIRDEPVWLPSAMIWMPAEIIITGVHLEEAMSECAGELRTMRLPLGWHPTASAWLSSKMDDQGVFDDVIEVCREEYQERTSR